MIARGNDSFRGASMIGTGRGAPASSRPRAAPMRSTGDLGDPLSAVGRIAAARNAQPNHRGRPETVKRGRAADPALGWREAQAQHSQLAQPPVDDVSGDMKNGQF